MKRLNSTDIARLAGVSRSTVSRVINQYPNVPEETRRRVMEVIKEHHYYPQFSGQLLSGMKSKTIGLFWLTRFSIAPDALSSSYFMHIVDAATESGYMVLSCILSDLTDKKNVQFVRRVFLEGRIDAGIFVGVHNDDPLLRELIDMGMTVGVFDYQQSGDHNPNCITANFERNSGEKAVDHLVSMGHTRIGTIHGELDRLSCSDRHASFLRGMEKHGLPMRDAWIVQGGITYSSGYQAGQQLLANCGDDLPTAIFAANDSVAFGLYQALREANLRVPEDISVVGVDGHVNAEHSNPPLTTISFNFREMFFSLVARVIDQIEQNGCDAPDVFFPGQLTERESCRKI